MQARLVPHAGSSILQAQIEAEFGPVGRPLSDFSAQPVTWPLSKNWAAWYKQSGCPGTSAC